MRCSVPAPTQSQEHPQSPQPQTSPDTVRRPRRAEPPDETPRASPSVRVSLHSGAGRGSLRFPVTFGLGALYLLHSRVCPTDLSPRGIFAGQGSDFAILGAGRPSASCPTSLTLPCRVTERTQREDPRSPRPPGPRPAPRPPNRPHGGPGSRGARAGLGRRHGVTAPGVSAGDAQRSAQVPPGPPGARHGGGTRCRACWGPLAIPPARAPR